MFGGRVFINKLPKNDEEPAIHIYTRPFDLKGVKGRPTLSIYMTPRLKSWLAEFRPQSLEDRISPINDNGLAYLIDLPDGKSLSVRLFSCKSYRLNSFALFEYENAHSLYVDRYPETDKIVEHEAIMELGCDDRIGDVYIDGSSANVRESDLKKGAIDEIEKFIRDEPDKQICLHLEDFGYEDFLVELARQGVNIFLDAKREAIFEHFEEFQELFSTNQPEANVIIADSKCPSAKEIKHRFLKEDIITLKFNPFRKDAPFKDGLLTVRYTPWPKFDDIFFIMRAVHPQRIHDVRTGEALPADILELCREE